jgi:CDP-diacylglycerol--glycerol-3-phosphate 3-phosphatidyltransferase
MGPFGIVDDEVATKAIFRTAEKGEEILLASGYFNLTDYYIQVILQESQAKYNILMASPEVCMNYLLLLIQIKVVLRVGGYFCKV